MSVKFDQLVYENVSFLLANHPFPPWYGWPSVGFAVCEVVTMSRITSVQLTDGTGRPIKATAAPRINHQPPHTFYAVFKTIQQFVAICR